MSVTLDNWQDPPYNRWAFLHIDEFLPTVPVPSGRRALPAPVAGLDTLASVPDLEQRLEASCTDALLVLRGSVVRAEFYGPGSGPATAHLLMSVSKSFCGLLVGILAGDGLLDVARTVDHYVPELRGSAYGDATVQQVLDMTVDVNYSEDYRDPASEVQQQDRAAGWRPRLPGDPSDTPAFLRTLRGGGDHGRRFRYCSSGTDVLGWVVEAVTGRRYADVLAERLWQPLGAERDATITVDSAGFATANAGMSCTARDLARLGRLVLDGGAVGDRQVVPSDWVAAILAGGDPRAAAGTELQELHPNGSYTRQWWITGDDRGVVEAVGIHGQYVWVDPSTDTVIVKLSTLPEAVSPEDSRFHVALFDDIAAALRS